MNYKAFSYDLRKDCVDIIMAGGSGHIGGDMSLMDILTYLYFAEMNVSPENRKSPDRDRFVLSKGHSMEAYYAVLCAKGYLDLEDVKKNFSQFGSQYIGHPNNKLPGIEMNSGSLGHGLPVCVGMALAGKMDQKDYRVYTVMGDGELAEGSVWEAAMSASQYKLDNLCAVVDRRLHRRCDASGQSGRAVGCLRLECDHRPRPQLRGHCQGIRRRPSLQGQAHGAHRRNHQGLWLCCDGGQGRVASPCAQSGRIQPDYRGFCRPEGGCSP